MPQLDFFIFTHIIVETILIFGSLVIIIWNTSFIKIFKALKTRLLFLKLLETTEITVSKSKIIKDNLFDIQKEIEEYENKIKAHE
jgi:hypothetical protein